MVEQMKIEQTKQPVILLYHIPVQEKIKLMQVLLRHGCQAVTVTREQYQTTLGVLAGVTEETTPAAVYTGSELPESMMVFCGCPDALLDILLADLRQSGVRVSLKAVLTPYNQSWTTLELYRELRQERQAILVKTRQKS
ncbi:MAG: DUF3783 domain-containing protein [Lachnospiraceae bacterium]|nr:DUF3783 domain-containing protein [Lachnospiraceae bacterium]